MPSEPFPKLLLKPAEAATSLGISTNQLWALTRAGEIPHLRIGRGAKRSHVRYRPMDLAAWIDRRITNG